MTTVDVVAFIRARLDEDEAAARMAAKARYSLYGKVRALVDQDNASAEERLMALHDPARVLRQVEALRRVVAMHYGEHDCAELKWRDPWCPTLRLLTSLWSDHPEYQEGWTP